MTGTNAPEPGATGQEVKAVVKALRCPQRTTVHRGMTADRQTEQQQSGDHRPGAVSERDRRKARHCQENGGTSLGNPGLPDGCS